MFFPLFAYSNCYLLKGRVTQSTSEYTDVAYKEKSLRIYYKKAEQKNLLPRGVSLIGYVEKTKDSRYITDYSAIDIPRRSVASSSESLEAVKLTKDGRCLRAHTK